MADELLFDYDPLTGHRQWFSTDEETGISYIRHEQDIGNILRFNKEMQADCSDDFKRGEMWHAAKIPITVMYEWAAKYGVEAWNPAHKDGVMRLLNDPDYRYLRVNHFII